MLGMIRSGVRPHAMCWRAHFVASASLLAARNVMVITHHRVCRMKNAQSGARLTRVRQRSAMT
jgi:hypothetical protein